MKLSEKGARFIAAREGFRSKPYHCSAGVLTIGYGFTNRSASFKAHWLDTRGHALQAGDRITKREAIELLGPIADEEYGKAVVANIGPQAQHHYDAAVSMAFNCGPASTKWKWGQALARGDVQDAARRLMKTGITAKQNGKRRRLQGLVNRRKMEAAILLNADYQQLAKLGSSGAKPRAQRDRAVASTGALERGSRGSEVRTLQVRLNAMNYHTGGVDGAFGSLTAAAVLAFQLDKDLATDAAVKVGGPTWNAISEAATEGFTRPVDAARRAAKGKDLKASRTVAASDKGSGAAVLGGGGALGVAVLSDASPEAFSKVEGIIGQFGLDWKLVGIAALGLLSFYLWKQLQNARAARLDDHRRGKTL